MASAVIGLKSDVRVESQFFLTVFITRNDLDAGIRYIHDLTGIRAIEGGSHPGMGTRNALLGIGDRAYLEIIAPDPAQKEYRSPRVFRVDDVSQPTLVTWAVAGPPIAEIAALTLPDGGSPGAALSGLRRRTDGVQLRWTLTDPYVVLSDGLVPFFIDWHDSPHPADSAPGGARLESLSAEHPDPSGVEAELGVLQVDLPVHRGPAPCLIAVLDTPKGTIELR